MDIQKKLKITVTQQDIDKGVCDSPVNCAIAKALKAQFRGKLRGRQIGRPVSVADDVRVNFRGGAYATYKLTDRANRFISKFDNNKKSVKPTSFILPLVYGYTDRGDYVAGVA